MDDHAGVRTSERPRAHRFALLLLACGVLASTASQASPGTGADMLSVPEIHAVWDAAVGCDGMTIVGKWRRPGEAEVIASRRLAFHGYEFTMPPLPGPASPVELSVVDADRSRGVVDHYLLLARDSLGPPMGAVVVTELPEGIRGHAAPAILDHVARMQTANARGVPGLAPEYARLDGADGPVLEMVVPGRKGSPCFPTSHFQVAGPGETPSLGISRFVVDGAHLVEFSLIVAVPDTPGANATAHAQAAMAEFSRSLARPDGAALVRVQDGLTAVPSSR